MEADGNVVWGPRGGPDAAPVGVADLAVDRVIEHLELEIPGECYLVGCSEW